MLRSPCTPEAPKVVVMKFEAGEKTTESPAEVTGETCNLGAIQTRHAILNWVFSETYGLQNVFIV